jgi:two-component system nitrate/nitrite response regulator NarL
MGETRTLFAGDLLTCDCLRQPLAQAGYQICGETRELRDSYHVLSVDRAEHDRPAMLLTDIDASCRNNDISWLRRIREARPDLKLVILTGTLSPLVVAQAWDAEVDGCFLKDLSVNLLVRSLHLIMLGQRILPDQLRFREPDASKPKRVGAPEARMLTAREEQILRLLLLGDSNKKIASRLNIGEMTVKLHLKTLLHKVGAHNRTQVAIWAHNHGYGVVAESYGRADHD